MLVDLCLLVCISCIACFGFGVGLGLLLWLFGVVIRRLWVLLFNLRASHYLDWL